ncbi:helix-turn-helix transcriptional regulator [Halostagnicola bangensis]
MTRSPLIGLLVLFVVVGTLSGGGTLLLSGTTAATAGESEHTATEQSVEPNTGSMGTSQEFDDTAFEVTIHENGSATWTFKYERALDEDDDEGDEVQAFEDWADEFESENTSLYRGFQYQAENLTESGVESSDREGMATNFEREAYVDQEGISQTGNNTGVVEMSFVWEGFAAVDDDGTVRAGDVFDEWVLLEDQRLTVSTDDSLEFQSVHEDGRYNRELLADANKVTWSGEMEFIPGEPRIVLDNPEESNEGGFLSSFDTFEDGTFSPLLAIIMIIAVLVGIGTFVRFRDTDDEAVKSTAGEEPGPTEAGATTTEPTEELQETELLTDEDRVVNLIEENGGRMKQVQIVDETGWSKSKVSMLLSEMEDSGTISKLRVGRENIISLEGHEPEATKSPFDE